MRSTRKRVLAGLASGGINPLEYTYNALIVPDGGLGGGVYGGRGFAQDSCRTDAGMRKCDELSSCCRIGNSRVQWPIVVPTVYY